MVQPLGSPVDAVARQIPLLDLRAQWQAIKDEVMQAIAEVMESQRFILGPKVKQLEEQIADYCGCRYAVGVSSGTDALLVSLMAEGIGPGDEVITTPYTFFATVGSILRVGARPVFVDIDLETYNIDPNGIEEKITPRTRAIIPVHLFGQCADMDPILEIADRHGLVVIEDAAQAIGAEYKGRRAGSMGHYGCFSFFPSKNLGGAGDGGMVTTNDSHRAERLRMLRSHGATRKYHHEVLGGNFRLDEIQAAVLLVKFKYLDAWTQARRKNAERYLLKLSQPKVEDLGFPNTCSKLETLILPRERTACRHVYNQFVIRLSNRDELQAYLAQLGVGSEIYYPKPITQQECVPLTASERSCFPNSDKAARETLALPVHPNLVVSDVDAIISAILDFLIRSR